jgi:hypothetical protein
MDFIRRGGGCVKADAWEWFLLGFSLDIIGNVADIV